MGWFREDALYWLVPTLIAALVFPAIWRLAVEVGDDDLLTRIAGFVVWLAVLGVTLRALSLGI